MTSIKALAAAALLSAMTVTPVFAQPARFSIGAAPRFAHASRRRAYHVRISAPRVHAGVTSRNAPGGICDFGDNPMIC
jgi:hypothetical protein